MPGACVSVLRISLILNEKDVMRADFALIDNAAVQVRQRAFDFELSGLPSMPNVVFEAFFGGKVGESCEVFGDVLLIF